MTTPAPDDARTRKAAERQAAVWPWLLIPLAALALFFVLSKVREESLAPPPGSVTATAPTR